MTAPTVITVALLAAIEMIRFTVWALQRLGRWMDRIYAQRRQIEAARAAAAETQRAELINVGAHAKWGLLRQAGLVDDRKRDYSDERSA